MKAHFRGGPHDRKRMEMEGDPVAFEVVKPNYTMQYDVSVPGPVSVMDSTIRGIYSRTMRPTKKGVYYFVWMGWDE